MRTKDYKVGDRIFYELFDGTIETDIIIGVKEQSYVDDKGKKIPYLWLKTWEEGNCSSGIEDYNCLSPNNPKCKEIAKRYKEFDRQKDKILNSIKEIISPYEKDVQKDILKILETKI